MAKEPEETKHLRRTGDGSAAKEPAPPSLGNDMEASISLPGSGIRAEPSPERVFRTKLKECVTGWSWNRGRKQLTITSRVDTESPLTLADFQGVGIQDHQGAGEFVRLDTNRFAIRGPVNLATLVLELNWAHGRDATALKKTGFPCHAVGRYLADVSQIKSRVLEEWPFGQSTERVARAGDPAKLQGGTLVYKALVALANAVHSEGQELMESQQQKGPRDAAADITTAGKKRPGTRRGPDEEVQSRK